MSVLSTYASGYKAYYQKDESPTCPRRRLGGCDEHEIGALTYEGTRDLEDPERHWWPRNADFLAEAGRHAKRPVGVASMAALVGAIRKQRGLTRVLWFGHGAKGELQFGGKQRLTAEDIASLDDVSAHFAEGGTIDFYACNAGQSPSFYQAIANRLRVTVRGFTKGVVWTVDYDGDSPHRFVTRRGIKLGPKGEFPEPDVTCQPQAPGQKPAGGPHGSLWLNPEGDVVHPDAPKGGGGPGFFRASGPLYADSSEGELPHPRSPAARTLDPVALQRLKSHGA